MGKLRQFSQGNYPDTLLYKAEESEQKMKEENPQIRSIWNTEWLSMQMSIKTVATEDEALDHIATYGSGHSESIVSGNESKLCSIRKTCWGIHVYAGCIHHGSRRNYHLQVVDYRKRPDKEVKNEE